MAVATKSPIRLLRAHLLPMTLFALVFAVSIVVRIRLLNAPLERDEGEHGYLAQTLLAGYAPWQIAYNMKPPGADFIYAAFLLLFGQTATAIRLGLLLVNAATILLTALLGKRLFGLTAGAVAGASYALLSCSQDVMGTIAHCTHYVAFFSVLATLLLLRAGTRPGWLFLSGLVYGLAVLMKQPGIFFGMFGAIFVLWRWRQARLSFVPGLKGIAAYCLGVALPYLLLCLELWHAGTFGRFWYWTYTLAKAYVTQQPPSLQLEFFEHFIPNVLAPNQYIWILAGLGLLLSLWMPVTRRPALFAALFLVLSSVAVCAGATYIPNYFILMLPAVALASGAWVASGEKLAGADLSLARKVPLILFAAACLYSVWMQRPYLFEMSPYEFSRSTYGLNPFPEAVQVAEYIRSHSDPGTPIAVLGSEAEIYFYSRRPAATGYIFTYGLMETHRYAKPDQEEMMSEIEALRPEFIVFVGIGTSWLKRADSPDEILIWGMDYLNRFYDIAGAVNLEEGKPTTYAWGEDAKIYNAGSATYMTVFRRRGSARGLAR
jgi:Dolichyl-phosphate-mannose-protein mannosyltransferase